MRAQVVRCYGTVIRGMIYKKPQVKKKKTTVRHSFNFYCENFSLENYARQILALAC